MRTLGAGGTALTPTLPPFDRAALTAALLRVADGDKAALRDVYLRTASKLYGICARIFSEPTEAEDALQDAFITIWQRAGAFDPAKASPITWLVVLTRNRAIDRLRASGRRLTSPIEDAGDIADETPDTESRLIQAQEQDRILACIETLAKGDATLIRTAFFDGSTYADIAARASLPLGTVKSRIRRALLRLRNCLS